MATAIVADLSRATRIRVVVETEPMTPARAIDLVRSHRALVTMRMHPALIAAGSGVPWALVVADDRLHPFDEPRLPEPDRTRLGTGRIRGLPARPRSTDPRRRSTRSWHRSATAWR